MRLQEKLLSVRSEQLESFETTVRAHIECILSSPHFDATTRSRDFFRFIVEETLGGRTDTLSQATIARAVFGRKENFDAILDPVVRVQAGRLRRSLERYYLLSSNNAVRVEIPRGAYAPEFSRTGGNSRRDATEVTNLRLTKVTSRWPAVSVHTFRDPVSRDGEVSARLSDELTMELCRYGNVRVVQPDDIAGFPPDQQAQIRFELRGSLRTVDEDRIVCARLVDRKTGVQIWSAEYHTGPDSGRWGGAIHEIARIIAANLGAEHGVVVNTLLGEQFEQGTDAASAFDAILRCYRFFNSGDVADLVTAAAVLQQEIASAPENAMAWTCLARLLLADYSYDLCLVQTPIDKTIGYAYQGFALDPSSVRAGCVLATALLVKGELESAQDVLVQLQIIGRDSIACREDIGSLLALTGAWDDGIAMVHETIQRNPYRVPEVGFVLWADHLRCREFNKAYVAALEYRDPSRYWRELMIVSCLGHLGRPTEAQASIAELRRAKPDICRSGRTLIGHYIKAQELREQIIAGLRTAGLTLQ